MNIEIAPFITQFMTGHENFASYLFRFGFRASPDCNVCGIKDTPKHILYGCLKFNAVRLELVCKLAEDGIIYVIKSSLDTKREYEIFSNWSIGYVDIAKTRIYKFKYGTNYVEVGRCKEVCHTTQMIEKSIIEKLYRILYRIYIIILLIYYIEYI